MSEKETKRLLAVPTLDQAIDSSLSDAAIQLTMEGNHEVARAVDAICRREKQQDAAKHYASVGGVELNLPKLALDAMESMRSSGKPTTPVVLHPVPIPVKSKRRNR